MVIQLFIIRQIHNITIIVKNVNVHSLFSLKRNLVLRWNLNMLKSIMMNT